MELTNREKRKLRLQPGVSQPAVKLDDAKKISQQPSSQKGSSKKLYILSSIVVFAIIVIVYSAYSFSKPGQYDAFSKCLAESGIVMYGAMDWCKYTQAQKTMFGKSFKYLNYKEFGELPGIKKTPTWVINGKWHENVQSFKRLSELTGCKL